MSWSGVKNQTNIENIKAWCDEMGIKDYTINSKGEINVNRDVNLRNKNLKELPYKFGRVNGYFTLAYNENLTSLKNCPTIVEGTFDIDGCSNINSLYWCPKEVWGNFWCRYCKRQFTREKVKSLCLVKCTIYN